MAEELELRSTSDVAEEGAFIIVHGRTGSGKTSLLRTIPEIDETLPETALIAC